jgi:PAS domain S-box-containing protein
MKFTKTILYTAVFALVGILTVFLVIYAQRNILNTYERNIPLIKLGENVKNRTTRAHLWFEELLAGDKSLNFDQHVRGPLVTSQQILQGAYEGKTTALGKFSEIASEDTRALLKEAAFAAENLSIIATELWQIHQAAMANAGDSAVQATSFITTDSHEQKFDADFEKFEAKMDQLIAHVNTQVKNDERAVSTISWITVIVVFVCFSLMGTLIFRLQQKNDQSITASESKLSAETKRVETLSQFIESVSAGNYEMELQAADEGDNLTGTLISMRDKLKQTSEDDRKRNWTTTGLAQIGDILRATGTTSTELYDNIIKFIVKYTKSHQGGLFIVTSEEGEKEILELVASYAFERKKYLQKTVDPGDGLVGQCFLEGETIYLTEVPIEYVTITSGLGASSPSALLVIPMKVNEKTYGVIELASFNKFADYEIELLEKLAESVASTISNVRVNDTTRILLEKTRQQSEEMKSQEEEIRQNMEELEATQEEMRRKQSVLERELHQSQQQASALQLQEQKIMQSQDTLQAIVDNIPRAIFWKDNDLRFMGSNLNFANIAGVESPRDLVGKTDFEMPWSAQADAYRKDDHEVMRSRKSKLDIEEVNINSNGEESWVRTSKVPIISQNGEVVAILGMFEDITIWKQKESDVAQKLKEREEALKELRELREMLES